jgi:small-conductance mechanosensitive channel
MSRRPIAFRKRTFASRTHSLLLAAVLLALAAPSGLAQNPILDALTRDGREAESADSTGQEGDAIRDPLFEIESLLAAANQRRNALDDAHRAEADPNDDDRSPSSSLEWADRLIRVLEQRREAQIRHDELKVGREAIETALNRDPRELIGEPPPFPVPILDGVMRAWREAVDREEQHAIVLKDRRANVELAEEVVEDLEKDRRRLREQLEKNDAPLERLNLESETRSLDDQLAVAKQQLALAEQLVENTTVEHGIKRIATRQAVAARAWIESRVAPRESDLADAVERLDRERFELDREIDLARSGVLDAEGILRAVEDRGPGDTPQASPATIDHELEITIRRRQLGHRQHLVAMLNQRIERLGRMRTTWQHRYAVLGDSLDLEKAPKWLSASEQELDRLTRSRRIKEAELANLQLEVATLLRGLAKAEAPSAPSARLREDELEDLEALVAFYQSDLGSLEDSIHLEERLRAELVDRLANRDLGERVRGAADSLRRFWSFEITTSEDSPITPGKILIALFVFAGGYVLARVLVQWLGRRFFPRLGFDAGASNAFASLSFYGFLAIVFLLALRAVNIPLTAFAVAGGALALGIGFGSQAIVSNFISGLLLLAERPIRMGDLIEIGGVVGSVESIGLRSTRIRTPDNFHIIVPNASFLESNVINWTHEDPLIRIRVAVGVAYGSPTREVERLLVQAAEEHERTLRTPAPAVYFEDFGDSALSFELRFWIRYDSRTDRSLIRSDLRFRIDQLFAENGIVIAFPQLDVHFDTRQRPPDSPSN